MMEASSKYLSSESKSAAGGVYGKFMDEMLTEHDAEAELFPDIPIKEELVEEVMQELYREITCAHSDDCTSTTADVSPSTVASPPSPAASFVVGNGKGESCGASVSDSASTVMVGVEYVGSTGGKKAEVGSGSSSEKGYGESGEVEGYDGVEVDDEWLARVLSWGPVELDPWF